MRIIQWAFPYLPTMGGREIFVERLCKSLTRSGHDIYVIAPPPSENEFVAPNYVHTTEFPVHRHDLREAILSKDSAQVEAAQQRLIADIARIQPDVIHLHTIGPEILILREALTESGLNPVFVYTHHDLVINNALWRHFLSTMDVIVSISQHSREALVVHEPSLGQKMVLIKNAVPVEANFLPILEGNQEIFAFGRLSEEKGFQFLLEAWAQLRPHSGGIKLVIAGEGPYGCELHVQAKRLEITESVEFPGWLSQIGVRTHLDQSRLVVVPSIWSEPFGLVAAEAQARARPVIASDVGALPDIVIHQQTGLIVPPSSPDLLSQAIQQISHDLPTLRSLGAQAFDHATQSLNWDSCVTEYETLYERMVISRD